jgi:ABC-type Mn2+/Zn2+ transport system ATPase subunit
MNETLLAEVEHRLYGADLKAAVADLVLTACMAPEELAVEQPGRAPRSPASPEEVIAPPIPARTYLSKIRVEGFRGIGAAAEVPLTPGPGLTLIIGRNGTGKSSLSDALEVLLTGTSARRNASKKNKGWLDGWRNVHHPHPARIDTDMLVEAQPGHTTIGRRWPEGAGFEDATTTVSRPGEANGGFAVLAWEEALAAYRPFLPYSELGGLLDDGPSKLFDTLNAILGLDGLTQAAKSLAERRLALSGRAKHTGESLARLRGRLAASDDPRAATVAAATAQRTADLGAVAAVLDGGSAASEDGDLDVLRRLAAVEGPESVGLKSAADRIVSAAAAADAMAATDAANALRTADLLRAALGYHQHGGGDCPVCGTPGALNAGWRDEASADERRLRQAAAEAEAAQEELAAAVEAARFLLRPPPPALSAAHPLILGADIAAAAWSEWARGPDSTGPIALAEHLRAAVTFADDVAAAAAAAGAAIEQRDASWRPLASETATWLADATADRRDAPRIKDLKSAEDWLKGVEDDIRADRFQPLAKASGEVWQALRMSSSVDVGGIRLAGSATRRRVEVQVNVDGNEGSALGVMSQGELHALALSLFLPRATLPESPFRFVVIDDPVQAMDPARVEGLARVLDETAASHQVIVLTHDDRLPEAVRRLGIAATVFEVTRQPGSAVTVTATLDPVRRRIADARTVAYEKELPASVRARVVPTLCRQALEAACVAAVRRRRLTRGDRHDDVEQVLSAAKKLYPLAALALFDDETKTADVLKRLAGWAPRLATAFQRCNQGAHEGFDGDLAGLVGDVSSLTQRIGDLA